MVSIEKGKQFVHAHGTLWERALWDYLFDNGSLKRVHQSLLCYKNEDGGWGHGLEHDIKCPDSNPLQLEFLLTVIKDTGLPIGSLLDGTPEWVELNLSADGTLANPNSLFDYPHAPWWADGGQSLPDAITGNLIRLGVCTPTITESTKAWVLRQVTAEKIRENKWLFMAYHAYDYFMNVSDFPELESYRQATIENILACTAEHVAQGELNKANAIFAFAPTPESEIAKALPEPLLEQLLDRLQASQREDGGWDDEHGLLYWQPYFSTVSLLTLQRYNRI